MDLLDTQLNYHPTAEGVNSKKLTNGDITPYTAHVQALPSMLSRYTILIWTTYFSYASAFRCLWLDGQYSEWNEKCAWEGSPCLPQVSPSPQKWQKGYAETLATYRLIYHSESH